MTSKMILESVGASVGNAYNRIGEFETKGIDPIKSF